MTRYEIKNYLYSLVKRKEKQVEDYNLKVSSQGQLDSDSQEVSVPVKYLKEAIAYLDTQPRRGKKCQTK